MIVESVRDLDLEVRVGAHIGEAHVDGHHVTGGAVHIASRVMSLAGPGEVLVSRALRDVVAGSDIELADRGIHRLKGVPGEFQLYAASHPIRSLALPQGSGPYTVEECLTIQGRARRRYSLLPRPVCFADFAGDGSGRSVWA